MTSPITIPTATILVSYVEQDQASLDHFQQLASQLNRLLNQPVLPCALNQPGNPVLDAIRDGLQQGAVKFVVLPLFLSPAEYRESAIAEAIDWASRRWSFLSFHVSPPLDSWRWVHLIAAVTSCSHADSAAVGVVLAHPGNAPATTQPEINGDLAKLARLLQESAPYRRVELAVLKPKSELEGALQQCQLAEAESLVVFPATLFAGEQYAQLQRTVTQLQKSTSIPLTLARPIDEDPGYLDALLSLHEKSLADDSLLPVSWDEVRRQVEASNADHRPQPISMGGDLPADEAQYQDLTKRIDAILPPRYQQAAQNGETISAAPMASADLQFDGEGNVAWDQMWGLDDPDSPFCELALAGGPPHRGDLLEPIPAEACQAEPGKYAAVLAELERGIQLVAGLPTTPSQSLGWIGVQCESAEMAIWLLRAIIVENVMVRREEAILYLPAGPEFALAGEIKNVVTVVAKTVHYWREHQMAMDILATNGSA